MEDVGCGDGEGSVGCGHGYQCAGYELSVGYGRVCGLSGLHGDQDIRNALGKKRA